MFILYLVIGALAGVLAGLLGIGGGIIVVPALAVVFSYFAVMPSAYIMHMAIGTSLATMIVTASSALRAYHTRGSVRWDLVRQLLPGLMIGSTIGAIIAHDLPSNYLRMLFGCFLLFAAFRLLVNKGDGHARQLPSLFWKVGISGIVGTLSSILGAGGGVMLLPFMLRYRVDLREAAGTTVACGLGVSVVATMSFMLLGVNSVNLPWSTGYIYWPAFLGTALASMACAPLGTSLAHQLPTALLKRILAVCLVLIAIDMLFI